jgi:hypothetical protein
MQVRGRNTVVIDLLIPVVSITLPPAAYQEVVVAGTRYPDAAVAGQRVEAGNIRVETLQPNADLATVLALYIWEEERLKQLY